MEEIFDLSYHKNLANYFGRKNLYIDEPNRKIPYIRKLVEQPWHFYSMNDANSLISFYRNATVFFYASNHYDFHKYEKYIVLALKGQDKMKGLFELFGLHIGNGEDFVSASNLLLFASDIIINDFSETSKEYVKTCYWIGWARNKMDDYHSSDYWFSKVKTIIIDTKMEGCDNYLYWCDEALKKLK